MIVLGWSLRAIENFGHRPSQRHFPLGLENAADAATSRRWHDISTVRDSGRHGQDPYQRRQGDDGLLGSSRSRLLKNSVVQLLISVTKSMAKGMHVISWRGVPVTKLVNSFSSTAVITSLDGFQQEKRHRDPLGHEPQFLGTNSDCEENASCFP